MGNVFSLILFFIGQKCLHREIYPGVEIETRQVNKLANEIVS